MHVAERPLVSIVTPTLNQRRFIESALRSVANQTYPRIEHVVVDGGSSDGTIDLLRRAESPSFQSISEPDRGMYEAINKGLRLANGEIVAYLNSDDAYLPWAVEAMVHAFEGRPRADVLFGDGLRIDHVSGAQELRLFPPFDPVRLTHRGSVLQPAVFWRRRLVERIGTFDDRMRFVADLDYWLRAAAVTEIGHVDEVIALDRVHGGALSSVRRDEMADEERELRTSHGADLGTDAGRRQHTRSVRSEKIWARRLWLRFLRARLAPEGPNRPWNRFLADAGTSVSLPRIVAGQVPRIGYPSLRTAVRSSLAAEILGVPT